jgi:regulator of sigma E protease
MVLLYNIIAFILLLLVVVFVHEFGHYIIAVLNGVQVDEFAIGYGKEIWAKTDRRGTKWKICVMPLGGFCKFFGDEDESSSMVNKEKLQKLTEEEKKKCLYFKTVWQRIAVVSAGPIFNYILAIVIFTFFFTIYGKNIVSNKVTTVIENSPAHKAGLLVNDKIISINGDKMEDFEEIQFKTMLSDYNKSLDFEILRDDVILHFDIIPEVVEKRDIFNKTIKITRVGITSNDFFYKKLPFSNAFIEGIKQTYSITKNTLKGLGQMIIGRRGMDDLSGPIKIAQYSGQALKGGFGVFVYFIAIVSTSLGLMNLLPIPILDGGHIFLYLIEALRGKKISEKMENILFRLGFSFLVTLMVFAILKDFIGIFK